MKISSTYLIVVSLVTVTVQDSGHALSRSVGIRILQGQTATGYADAADSAVSSDYESRPFATTGMASGRFVEVDSSISGVDFANEWPDSFDIELPGSFIAAGIAVGDFNQDGLPDFFAARRKDGGKLYQNLGDFRFKDVTQEWGLDLEGMWATGVTFVDINNDGRLDLSICGLNCNNRIYVNLGDRFEDQAAEWNANYRGPSVALSYVDYDRDGDLDAYLLTNSLQSDRMKPAPPVEYDASGRPVVPPGFGQIFFYVTHPDGGFEKEWGGRFDFLLRNDGDRFVNVSQAAGVARNPFMGLSATWWDYNSDGWPDLYVSNDFKGPDHLFRNNGRDRQGQVTFTDVSRQGLPHTPWFSMGSDIADINNDGRMELLATDMAGTNHYRDKLSMGPMSGPDSRAWFLNWPKPPQYMRNCVYVNTGTENFMEAAYLTGLASTDWTWTVRFCDFDQDGRQDVYFTNGMSRDWFNGDLLENAKAAYQKAGAGGPGRRAGYEYWFSTPRFELENLAFRNKGDFKFEDVSEPWGLRHRGVSTGGATGDFDDDGDMDLIVNGFNEPLKIYRNETNAGNAVKIYLQGRSSNRQAIGAEVVAETVGANGEPVKQLRYLNANQGIMSGSEPVIHFGLGAADRVSRLEIRWPSGIRQLLVDIAANQELVVTEPEQDKGEPLLWPTVDAAKGSGRMFQRSGKVFPAELVHRETPYDDFENQPLIPNRYSQLGPGTAWGDIDGDGDFDCFFGGSREFPSRIVVNQNGRFALSEQEALERDKHFEDMGGLFFDADRDGDLDLYVVSGGGEKKSFRGAFQDRLYLNDGRGKFDSATMDALPFNFTSGSCVAGTDFDRDGDIDLFVGGRIVPGEFPSAPQSFLLANEQGKFQDVTDSMAPGLGRVGMVTSAIWSDVNNDNWQDLVVACEWGPIHLFLNREGTLEDVTDQCQLIDFRGWFNSIACGDIDNDGDMDLVAGNWGLNSKYKATDEKPELLYFGDFDGSGEKHILEAKYEGDRCLPRRGLGCSSDAMPFVKDRKPTFHEFAISSLSDIYSSDLIDKAELFSVNCLESLVMINESTEGEVSFRVSALPRLAQISPIFGLQLVEIDGDGNLDLAVAQNFFGPQRETGNVDGGVSMIFRGDGDGNFSPIWPDRSGFHFPGDAKCLTTIDFNGDHRPDLMVGLNNQAPLFFRNTTDGEPRSIRLVGPDDNRNAIGTRLLIEWKDGSRRAHEIGGGEGYLSQSPPVVYVASPKGIRAITVRWPDGTSRILEQTDFSDGSLTINYQKR